MAEARVEDDEESLREPREAGGARRNPRAPSAASGRADRNKPEQRQCSSQGALSSIRAVIKRTSTRTAAPSNQNRERRRPEITILAAEPLATNPWFPGPSGAFPPPPPPAQPSWTTSVTVELPPPSYEQVIREKSREQNISTSSVSTSSSSSSPSSSLSSSSSSTAPRHSATISTQTDPEVSESHSCNRPSMRRPPKPPRPSFPPTPKPAKPVLVHSHSLLEQANPEPCTSTHTPTHPPSGDQCGVQTDFTPTLEPSILISPDYSNITHNSQSQSPVKHKGSARPRPRSRSKALQQSVITEESLDQPVTREVKVQTLVRLKDDSSESVFAAFSDTSSDAASNTYLQDLLEVFGCDLPDIQRDQHYESDHGFRSDKEKRVTSESCSVSTVAEEPSETITRPEPRPRTRKPKPAVAAKPPDPTPLSAEATKTSAEEQNKPAFRPVPAPRPLVRKSAMFQPDGSSVEKSESCPHHLTPRPPLATWKSGDSTQEGRAHPAGVPVAVTSSSRDGRKCPAMPPSHRGPPPPTHTPTQDAVRESGPSLTHRESRPLPLRPPPIKSSKSACPSQTSSAPNLHSGSRGAKRGPALPPRPKPGHPVYREYKSEIHQVNATKVIRPLGDPDESDLAFVVLEDTPGFPHGQHLDSEDLMEKQPPETNTSVRYRAHYAFTGEDGELTFCDGDVITLVDYVNEEWGCGSLNGRTGNFPLNFVQLVTESPATTSTPNSSGVAPTTCVGEGQTGRALYDFTPESEEELCLKVGDVVSSLEEVDEEWFVGESAGRRGIVPKNYIQVL